jgi:hypothetical protein
MREAERMSIYSEIIIAALLIGVLFTLMLLARSALFSRCL